LNVLFYLWMQHIILVKQHYTVVFKPSVLFMYLYICVCKYSFAHFTSQNSWRQLSNMNYSPIVFSFSVWREFIAPWSSVSPVTNAVQNNKLCAAWLVVYFFPLWDMTHSSQTILVIFNLITHSMQFLYLQGIWPKGNWAHWIPTMHCQ